MPLIFDQYLASKGISLTALGTFDKCPLQFAVRYLKRPGGGRSKAPVPGVFKEGIALHHAIELGYRALLTDGKRMAFAELEAGARESLSELSHGDTGRSVSKKLGGALRQFFELYYDRDRYIPIAVEFGRLVSLAPGINFNFRVDLLARDTETGENCVVDFKIGRPRFHDVRLSEAIQTGAYAWGLDQILQVGITSAHVVYLSSGGRETFTITPAYKESFRHAVLEMIRVVRETREFVAKPSKTKCSVCDYRLACPHSLSK